MKNFIVILVYFVLFSIQSFSQSNIQLSGSIGVSGNVPILGKTLIVFSSDANLTMTALQASSKFLQVTSSVSLTNTRNLIAPQTEGQEFTVYNTTTGGQSIDVIGTTGSGVIIPNGQIAEVVYNGTNYQIISGGASYYQTVEDNGTSNTQETNLNLKSGTGASVSCTDNSENSSTDCTISATSEVGIGTTGQAAVYLSYGNAVQGGTLGISGGGTGATTAAGADANLSIPGPVVNVAYYGAVGDWNGSTGTDNTSAFAAACAASISLGLPVYIPAGKYLTDTISSCTGNTIDFGGAGMDETYFIPKSGDTFFKPSGTTGVASAYLHDFTVTGQTGTGAGIYFSSSLSFVEDVSIDRVKIVPGQNAQAVYFPVNATNVSVSDSVLSSQNNNIIEIGGGPGVLLRRDYLVDAGSGYSGVYAHGGAVTLLSMNGLNAVQDGETWFTCGDGTATCYGTVIGSNIESFTKYGIHVKGPSQINLINDSFLNNNTWAITGGDTVEALLFDYSQFPSTIDSLTAIGTGGGSIAPWTNGYPVHASYGVPFSLANYSTRQSNMTTYYNDSGSAIYNTPVTVSGSAGYLTNGTKIYPLQIANASGTALASCTQGFTTDANGIPSACVTGSSSPTFYGLLTMASSSTAQSAGYYNTITSGYSDKTFTLAATDNSVTRTVLATNGPSTTLYSNGLAALTATSNSMYTGLRVLQTSEISYATATTGGTLTDATTYYYRVASCQSATTCTPTSGQTTPSAETSKITGSGGNLNTITVTWSTVYGAAAYNVYCRTTGAEQLCASMVTGNSWTDTGSVTPSGAMPTYNSTIMPFTIGSLTDPDLAVSSWVCNNSSGVLATTGCPATSAQNLTGGSTGSAVGGSAVANQALTINTFAATGSPSLAYGLYVYAPTAATSQNYAAYFNAPTLIGTYNASNNTALVQSNLSGTTGVPFSSYQSGVENFGVHVSSSSNMNINLYGQNVLQDNSGAVTLGYGGTSVTISQKATVPSTQGSATASFASGAGAGSSPGTPACAGSHTCDSIGGTVAMTTGTATPTTGVALTVTTGITRSTQPTCSIQIRLATSPYTLVDSAPTTTATTIVFNLTGTSLTASTAYNFSYNGCDGN